MTKSEVQNHPVYQWLRVITHPDFHDKKNCKGPYTDGPKLQAVYEMCGGKGNWAGAMSLFMEDVGCWKAFIAYSRNMPEEWKAWDTRTTYVSQRRAGAFAVILSHLGPNDDDAPRKPCLNEVVDD